MAEQQQQRMAAPFPAPPPFYKHFTKRNAKELQRLRKAAGRSDHDNDETGTSVDQKRDLDTLSLPPELRCLIPPAPPTDGTFKAFGAHLALNAPSATLADLGIERLYPDHPSVYLNPQYHLISLARSQLTTYLTLVGAMSQDAESWPPFAADLETITYNMHDLINRYRPHQARETVILMMEERIERMKDEIKQIREGREKVEGLMKGLQDGGGDGGPQGMETDDVVRKEGGTGGKRKARQRAAWAALEGMGQEG